MSEKPPHESVKLFLSHIWEHFSNFSCFHHQFIAIFSFCAILAVMEMQLDAAPGGFYSRRQRYTTVSMEPPPPPPQTNHASLRSSRSPSPAAIPAAGRWQTERRYPSQPEAEILSPPRAGWDGARGDVTLWIETQQTKNRLTTAKYCLVFLLLF